jgi:hypothetical protein
MVLSYCFQFENSIIQSLVNERKHAEVLLTVILTPLPPPPFAGLAVDFISRRFCGCVGRQTPQLASDVVGLSAFFSFLVRRGLSEPFSHRLNETIP